MAYDDDEKFDEIKKHYDETVEHPLGPDEVRKDSDSDPSLGDREAGAAGKRTKETPGEDGAYPQRSLQDQLKYAEERGNPGGLYSPAEMGEFPRGGFATRIRNTNKRRSAFIALGAGGLVATVLAIFTIGPIFRIPALMSGILGKVGGEAREMVEDRAQRQIVLYLIQRAGGNPTNYVIVGSPLESLWATFKTNRLEDKIFKQTGLRILKDPETGRVYLEHDGRDKGQVKNYADVQALLAKDQLLAKDMRKLVRLVVPAWHFMGATKMARYFRLKYQVNFRTRDYDKTKTPEENIAGLRSDQIQVTDNQTVNKIGQIMDCILSDNCDSLRDTNDPIDTTRAPPPPEHAITSGNQVASDVTEAAQNVQADVASTGSFNYSQRMTEAVVGKMASATVARTTAAALPGVGQIDLLSQIVHGATAFRSEVGSRLPAILAAAALGAMFASWQGHASQIMAKEMDLNFIKALNEQLIGSEVAMAAYHMAGEIGKGVAPITKVYDNVENIRDKMLDWFMNGPMWAIRLPLEIWYETAGKLIGLVGELGGAIFNFFLGDIIQDTLEAIFGPDWEAKMMETIARMMMSFLGLAIDPLATGAKMLNQLYVGGAAAINAFGRANLGLKAMTQMITGGILDPPPGFASAGVAPSMNLAGMPLGTKLFSMDEPYSFANQTFRSIPVDDNPLNLLGSLFRQIARLPGTLLAALTPKSSALTQSELNAEADLTAVRQYGSTAEDRNQDIAPEVRLQIDTVCPEVDQNVQVNICKPDLESTGSLKCLFPNADCPEFVDSAANSAVQAGRVSGQGDPKEIAGRLLAKEVDMRSTSAGISFVPPYGRFGKQDLETIRDGDKIDDCGGGKTLDVAMLQMLDELSKVYNVGVGVIVTEHGCTGYHPKGMAVDVNGINGQIMNDDNPGKDMAGIDPALVKKFVDKTISLFPLGRGAIGQRQCTPMHAVTFPAGVHTFNDFCHHIHIDTRENT